MTAWRRHSCLPRPHSCGRLALVSGARAQLSQIANHSGTDTEQLVKDAALRLLQDDAHFREGVERGIAAAGRGEFVEHGEVWANIEKILQS